jgi:hypothetical protein
VTVQLRDGRTVEDPRLDWLPYKDARSRNYPIRELLGATGPRSYTWGVPGGRGQVLDQGREGACVGFAWAAERAARPIPRPTTNADALAIYRAAQVIDEWPGEAYSGTSVLAGAKVARERGWLREYRWAFGLDDALAAISRHGPAVLGIPWYDSMYRPTVNNGRATITVSGSVVGGHAILARGVSVRRRQVMLRNSWSASWGLGGDAWISWDDLGRLLADGGEACVPVLR